MVQFICIIQMKNIDSMSWIKIVKILGGGETSTKNNPHLKLSQNVVCYAVLNQDQEAKHFISL